MNGGLLVLNAGSSSIKFGVFAGDAPPGPQTLLCEGQCEGIGHELRFSAVDRDGRELLREHAVAGRTHRDALASLLAWLEAYLADHPLAAVGHRVVHGGTAYGQPVRIDAAVVEALRALVPLAPLHQPHHLSAIEAVASLHPGLPQVACFDTAFHRTQPAVASAFALPRRFADGGLRRYGFHGLSYEYVAAALPSLMGAEAAAGRIVIAHLGSGASLCAMRAGRSLATTMGFTPLDGIPMGRRCGAIDPGAVLYMIQRLGMTADEVSHLLYFESGLLGVSGISDDMRTLLASAAPSAREAVDLFIYRVVREIGSLAAALGGLDALVFTAGIGEHAPLVRRRIAEGAAWLGLRLDAGANEMGGPRISGDDSAVSAWVVPTHEDVMIARHTWTLLAAPGGDAPA